MSWKRLAVVSHREHQSNERGKLTDELVARLRVRWGDILEIQC